MFSSVARSTRALDARDLQRHRGLEQFAERHLVQDQRAGQSRRELVVARQAGLQPAAGIAADQSALLEHANAFAHRRAVDAELRNQLLLGADRLARLDPPVDDLAFDRVGDLLIGRRDIDAPEQRRGGHLQLPGAPDCRLSDKG
ncbi:hypothetical protein ACVMDO_003481 [Bradyrhizobium sp. USDA 4513]